MTFAKRQVRKRCKHCRRMNDYDLVEFHIDTVKALELCKVLRDLLSEVITDYEMKSFQTILKGDLNK